MRVRVHTYDVEVSWTGNRGEGTSGYRSYDRANEVRATETPAPAIPGSSDPHFRGDDARWNPEQLLVASLSQCHMLWYLHLASEAGVIVVAYDDAARGTMEESGGGRFTEVVLRPRVQVADPTMVEAAQALHERAHELCFVANSVNFPVRHEPVAEARASGATA